MATANFHDSSWHTANVIATVKIMDEAVACNKTNEVLENCEMKIVDTLCSLASCLGEFPLLEYECLVTAYLVKPSEELYAKLQTFKVQEGISPQLGSMLQQSVSSVQLSVDANSCPQNSFASTLSPTCLKSNENEDISLIFEQLMIHKASGGKQTRQLSKTNAATAQYTSAFNQTTNASSGSVPTQDLMNVVEVLEVVRKKLLEWDEVWCHRFTYGYKKTREQYLGDTLTIPNNELCTKNVIKQNDNSYDECAVIYSSSVGKDNVEQSSNDAKNNRSKLSHDVSMLASLRHASDLEDRRTEGVCSTHAYQETTTNLDAPLHFQIAHCTEKKQLDHTDLILSQQDSSVMCSPTCLSGNSFNTKCRHKSKTTMTINDTPGESLSSAVTTSSVSRFSNSLFNASIGQTSIVEVVSSPPTAFSSCEKKSTNKVSDNMKNVRFVKLVCSKCMNVSVRNLHKSIRLLKLQCSCGHGLTMSFPCGQPSLNEDLPVLNKTTSINVAEEVRFKLKAIPNVASQLSHQSLVRNSDCSTNLTSSFSSKCVPFVSHSTVKKPDCGTPIVVSPTRIVPKRNDTSTSKSSVTNVTLSKLVCSKCMNVSLRSLHSSVEYLQVVCSCGNSAAMTFSKGQVIRDMLSTDKTLQVSLMKDDQNFPNKFSEQAKPSIVSVVGNGTGKECEHEMISNEDTSLTSERFSEVSAEDPVTDGNSVNSIRDTPSDASPPTSFQNKKLMASAPILSEVDSTNNVQPLESNVSIFQHLTSTRTCAVSPDAQILVAATQILKESEINKKKDESMSCSSILGSRKRIATHNLHGKTKYAKSCSTSELWLLPSMDIEATHIDSSKYKKVHLHHSGEALAAGDKKRLCSSIFDEPFKEPLASSTSFTRSEENIHPSYSKEAHLLHNLKHVAFQLPTTSGRGKTIGNDVLPNSVVSTTQKPALRVTSAEQKNPPKPCNFQDLMVQWIDTHISKKTKLSMLRQQVLKLCQLSTTSVHFYMMVDLLHDKFGDSLLQLYVELYIRALTVDINLMENARLTDPKEEIEVLENEVADSLCKLANFLGNHPTLARECILSAFSISPSKDHLAKLYVYGCKQPDDAVTPAPSSLTNGVICVPCSGECHCDVKGECQWNLNQNSVKHKSAKNVGGKTLPQVDRDTVVNFESQKYVDDAVSKMEVIVTNLRNSLAEKLNMVINIKSQLERKLPSGEISPLQCSSEIVEDKPANNTTSDGTDNGLTSFMLDHADTAPSGDIDLSSMVMASKFVAYTENVTVNSPSDVRAGRSYKLQSLNRQTLNEVTEVLRLEEDSNSEVDSDEEKVDGDISEDIYTAYNHILHYSEERLPDNLLRDLTIILNKPRSKLLTWDLNWPELESRCKLYLEQRSLPTQLEECVIVEQTQMQADRDAEDDTQMDHDDAMSPVAELLANELPLDKFSKDLLNQNLNSEEPKPSQDCVASEYAAAQPPEMESYDKFLPPIECPGSELFVHDVSVVQSLEIESGNTVLKEVESLELCDSEVPLSQVIGSMKRNNEETAEPSKNVPDAVVPLTVNNASVKLGASNMNPTVVISKSDISTARKKLYERSSFLKEFLLSSKELPYDRQSSHAYNDVSKINIPDSNANCARSPSKSSYVGNSLPKVLVADTIASTGLPPPNRPHPALPFLRTAIVSVQKLDLSATVRKLDAYLSATNVSQLKKSQNNSDFGTSPKTPVAKKSERVGATGFDIARGKSSVPGKPSSSPTKPHARQQTEKSNLDSSLLLLKFICLPPSVQKVTVHHPLAAALTDKLASSNAESILAEKMLLLKKDVILNEQPSVSKATRSKPNNTPRSPLIVHSVRGNKGTCPELLAQLKIATVPLVKLPDSISVTSSINVTTFIPSVVPPSANRSGMVNTYPTTTAATTNVDQNPVIVEQDRKRKLDAVTFIPSKMSAGRKMSTVAGHAQVPPTKTSSADVTANELVTMLTQTHSNAHANSSDFTCDQNVAELSNTFAASDDSMKQTTLSDSNQCHPTLLSQVINSLHPKVAAPKNVMTVGKVVNMIVESTMNDTMTVLDDCSSKVVDANNFIAVPASNSSQSSMQQREASVVVNPKMKSTYSCTSTSSGMFNVSTLTNHDLISKVVTDKFRDTKVINNSVIDSSSQSTFAISSQKTVIEPVSDFITAYKRYLFGGIPKVISTSLPASPVTSAPAATKASTLVVSTVSSVMSCSDFGSSSTKLPVLQ